MDLTTDVLYGDGQENMAGIKKIAFLAFVSSFTTISTPVASPSDYASRVTIATAHVLASTKKVIQLYVMYDKSGIESPLQGMRKGKSFKPKLTLFYPGTDAACLGLIGLIKNSDLLTWAQPQDGTGLYQVGTEGLPASLTAGSVKTGTAPDGEKGITFEIEAPSHEAFYVYTASLPTVGA